MMRTDKYRRNAYSGLEWSVNMGVIWMSLGLVLSAMMMTIDKYQQFRELGGVRMRNKKHLCKNFHYTTC